MKKQIQYHPYFILNRINQQWAYFIKNTHSVCYPTGVPCTGWDFYQLMQYWYNGSKTIVDFTEIDLVGSAKKLDCVKFTDISLIGTMYIQFPEPLMDIVGAYIDINWKGSFDIFPAYKTANLAKMDKYQISLLSDLCYEDQTPVEEVYRAFTYYADCKKWSNAVWSKQFKFFSVVVDILLQISNRNSLYRPSIN